MGNCCAHCLRPCRVKNSTGRKSSDKATPLETYDYSKYLCRNGDPEGAQACAVRCGPGSNEQLSWVHGPIPGNHPMALSPTVPANGNVMYIGSADQRGHRMVVYPKDVHNSKQPITERMMSSVCTLQHISEREPDDMVDDPSLNPNKETLFMQRSIRDVEQSIRKRRSIYDRNLSRRRLCAASLMYRSNSTSSIQLDDSTVSRPNQKSTVRSLSRAVYLQIKNRDRRRDSIDVPGIFDERLHPVHQDSMSPDVALRDPDPKQIFGFIKTIFRTAQLSPECAIVTMVYLERLLTSAEMELTPATWKRIVLCAILLASKVWDDQAVWNVDYCQILEDLDVDDVNELERQFLEILQFNINVPSSVYAKYYFDIRSLRDDTCQTMPLSVERAYKLEAYSRVLENSIFDDLSRRRSLRRWGSLDTMTMLPNFRPAILS